MVVGLSIDVISAAKEIIKIFKKREKKKFTLGEFFKVLEDKYKIKLSKDGKKELIYSLYERGYVEILKSRYGKKYIVPGGIEI